jgi:hypothetical protein
MHWLWRGKCPTRVGAAGFVFLARQARIRPQERSTRPERVILLTRQDRPSEAKRPAANPSRSTRNMPGTGRREREEMRAARASLREARKREGKLRAVEVVREGDAVAAVSNPSGRWCRARAAIVGG